MEVNRQGLFASMLTGLIMVGTAQASNPPSAPAYITFTNETPLAFDTSIAGLPGYGIAPSVTRPVSYNIVSSGCVYKKVADNCPIDFLDKQTGAKVATVYINAPTATLNAQPILYGEYATQYEILGWEQSPLNHITIIKKA